MTFPGESLAVWSATNLSGTPIPSNDAISYRAGESTFNASDSAQVLCYLYPLLLEPGTPDVDVSWVVEVLSGSGTLSLAEAAGSLGSHAVTGPSTLVLPSALTVDDVTGGGSTPFTITCDSGTVVVQQIKLRVWPTGGVIGGFGDVYQPGAVTRGALSYALQSFLPDADPIEADTGEEALALTQANLRAKFAAGTIGTLLFVDTDTIAGARYVAAASHFYGPPEHGSTFEGSVGAAVAYMSKPTPFYQEPPGDLGVDWIWPPNEVPDDHDGWDIVGEDSWGWAQGVATLSVESGTVASGDLHVAVDYVTEHDAPSTPYTTLAASPYVTAPSIPGGGTLVEFTLPPADPTKHLRFVLWHDGAYTEQAVADTIPIGIEGYTLTTGQGAATVLRGRWDSGVFRKLSYAFTPGAYRYWTLTATRTIPLRQLHRDDGLGVTPPRAYGGASRIRTGRAYGYD